jgi:hypothetical protein
MQALTLKCPHMLFSACFYYVVVGGGGGGKKKYTFLRI